MYFTYGWKKHHRKEYLLFALGGLLALFIKVTETLSIKNYLLMDDTTKILIHSLWIFVIASSVVGFVVYQRRKNKD
jgi:bifunctional DNase/RNase